MDYGAAPEDAALCRQWLGQYSRRFGHYIDGAWVTPADGRYFSTRDPSTGATLAEIAQGNAADVEFTWRWIPLNEVGAALYSGEAHYRSTALFRDYDDGWRVVQSTSHAAQPLDEALKNAEPTQ